MVGASQIYHNRDQCADRRGPPKPATAEAPIASDCDRKGDGLGGFSWRPSAGRSSDDSVLLVRVLGEEGRRCSCVEDEAPSGGFFWHTELFLADRRVV